MTNQIIDFLKELIVIKQIYLGRYCKNDRSNLIKLKRVFIKQQSSSRALKPSQQTRNRSI